MKPTDNEELLARWLDGELNEAERAAFEARLAADPSLRAEAEARKEISTAMHQGFQRQVEVPHADFFNSQIQERIDELRRDEAKGQPERDFLAGGLFGWFAKKWLIAAAAAACLLLAVMQLGQSENATVVLSTYAPNGAVQANTFHSDAAEATVLMLDGLAALPADRKLVGYQVHRSETDQAVAMTTLFDNAGGVLLVLAKDARNQPQLIAH
jgi:anti-sigma factor RsiW